MGNKQLLSKDYYYPLDANSRTTKRIGDKIMTLRQAIDTVISHNAIIILQEDEQNHYAHSVWKGVLHQLPKEYLDREFKPICDYVNYEKQYECPIIIDLKSIED